MAEPNGYIQGSNGVLLELIDKTARAELSKKLTRPATAQVGDYLRIKAIGEDGTMEVEAVPAPTGGATVPTKVSAFENDAGYTTEARVQELLAAFPTFKIEVVQELPAVGAEKTLYLIPFADDSESYLEYLYVNGAWEVVGNGKDSVANVNPVSKTEDMTQPVGVDENGLLWTAPTDGGTDSDGDTREEIVGVTPFEVLKTGLFIRPEADTRLYSATDGLENLMEQFQTVETDATKINYGVATNTLIEAQSIVEGQTPVTIAHIYGYSAEPGEYTLLVKSTTKTFIRVMKRTNSNNLGMAPSTNLTSGYTNSVVNFTVTEEDVATHLCNIGVKITATGMVLPDTFSIKLVKGKFDAMPDGVSLDFQVAAGQKFPLDAFQGITAYSEPVTNVYRTITTEGDGTAEPTSGMLLCFGDSLTATKYSMYPEMLTEMGMNAINFGVSGTSLRAVDSPYCMCSIVDALKSGDMSEQIEGGQNENYENLLSLMPTATGIVIWFGTNDYNGDCAFEGDGTDSIEGALRYVLTELFALYPKKAIYVVSPFMYTYAYGHQPENPNGTVAEMIQVMRGVCEEFAVPFIDMSRESGFNQITRLTLTSDKLHPDTQAGRERLAAFLFGKLRSLGC